MNLSDHLKNIIKLHLNRSWNGLSQIAPIEADYKLQLENGKFLGEAFLSVAWEGAEYHKEETVEISIDEKHILKFLDLLSEVSIKEGKYNSHFTHTDDFPDLLMEFHGDKKYVKLFSTSQGKHHVRWGAEIESKEYVIDSPIPDILFELLEIWLVGDKMEKLEEKVWSENGLR